MCIFLRNLFLDKIHKGYILLYIYIDKMWVQKKGNYGKKVQVGNPHMSRVCRPRQKKTSVGSTHAHALPKVRFRTLLNKRHVLN